MAPTTVKLRCDSEQLAHWKASAEQAGEDFSKWARRLLDESANGQHIYLKSEPRARIVAGEVLDVEVAAGISPSFRKPGVAVASTRVRRDPPAAPARVARATPPSKPEPEGPGGDVGERAPVRHTATSNWLTCLCPECIRKRAANDIPLGGMPPKKKGFKR
jgi:hypothetical protein